MKAVLPGQPEASLQALSTGCWDGKRIVVYITGNALAILSDPETIIQTIYDEDERPLEAVTFDESSGKIAACTGRTVRIYKPLGCDADEALLKWVLQTTFDVNDEADTRTTLSWGSSQELLVGRASLHLHNTTASPPTRHWRMTLPSPVRIAALSYDSAYIASVAHHDRLVKVWRRLNFSSDEVHFDFGYLPHPQAVTRMQWKKPVHVEQTIENVLYTLCVDKVMRIWTGANGHGCETLRLWGKVDLATAIQDESLRGRPALRWACIVSQRDLAVAAEKAVQEKGDGPGQDDVALQNLISIANRDTEICMVLDGRGNMAAYALENISSKSKSANNIEKVGSVKSRDFDFLAATRREGVRHVEILTYSDESSGRLHILLHRFDGVVDVYTSKIGDLLDPSPKPGRLRHRATWSGHSAAIKKIVRSYSGRSVVSRTELGECMVWKHVSNGKETKLVRSGTILEKRHIHRICLLRGGSFVVFLHHDSVCLWDCRSDPPELLAEMGYRVAGKPLCILVLPRQRAEEEAVAHIATITSERRGTVWELHLPIRSQEQGMQPTNGQNGTSASVREFCTFDLEGAGDLAYVLPVDPAGAKPVVSGFLDVFARDVAVSYTHSGRVVFWTARVDVQAGRVEWLSTSSMETGVMEPALVSGSRLKKAALVTAGRCEVTIWDIRGARAEWAQDFGSHTRVQDLDWTSTPDSQSVLAVGFPYRVVLVSEMRFDYLNKGPAWAPIREINIRPFTPHPIGDSTWLSDGHLVIGAGHQLFVYDRIFEASDSLVASTRLPHRKDRDLLQVVQRLNGPLPIFHPQFLGQCILSGKNDLVHRILLALNHTLKFHVEDEAIDDYLGLDLAEVYDDGSKTAATSNRHARPDLMGSSLDEDDENVFTEDIAVSICDKLQTVAMPQLSRHEQMQLMDIVECVGVVEKQRRSVDENAARFMLFARQHALRKGRTNEIQLSWREINWAYHSTSQDILTDSLSRQYRGTMLWVNARESGVSMWLADAAAVKAQFEIVARNEYGKSEPKNPVDCSLFYLALKKKTVLTGLWRMASWNREQAATQRLLANNFEDEKWKTAALKNAYALLSKRRFEYAAAFFLLAGSLQDAVNVCMNQIGDLQLAIAIARVYEGDSGPVLRNLLEKDVLAIAAKEGNRWLASWAFWMLRRRDMAVRALITPVYNLLETPVPPDLRSKLFLTDDPALIVLYSQLREKTLQTLRGAAEIGPRTEWDFVLHNARLYDRMGCDLLGLDLVRNWVFFRTAPSLPSSSSPPSAAAGDGAAVDPTKLLRRRTSLVIADLPLSPRTGPTAHGEAKTGAVTAAAAGGKDKDRDRDRDKVQPPPSVFEEPDMGSLLDSFGL